MLRVLFTLLIHFFASAFVLGQYHLSDSITVIKKGLGNSYFHKLQPISERNINPFIKTNSEAKKKLNRARTALIPVYLLGIGGSVLVGYQLGRTIIAGESMEWISFSSGLIATGVSISFEALANKRKREAVQIYNLGLYRYKEHY